MPSASVTTCTGFFGLDVRQTIVKQIERFLDHDSSGSNQMGYESFAFRISIRLPFDHLRQGEVASALRACMNYSNI